MKKTLLVISSLTLISINAQASYLEDYSDLNQKLIQIHKAYLKRDFNQLDKIKDSFLKTHEIFMKEYGERRPNMSKAENQNVELSVSYYRSLSNFYPDLKIKYGYQKELIHETSDKQTATVAETIEAKNDQSETDSENDENLLLLEIPDRSNDDADEIEGVPASAESKRPEEKDSKTVSTVTDKIAEDTIITPNPELVKKIYESEKNAIEKGLEKLIVLRENQARFEKTVISTRSVEIKPNLLPVKNRSIFSTDRLKEIDEDIIILKVREN